MVTLTTLLRLVHALSNSFYFSNIWIRHNTNKETRFILFPEYISCSCSKYILRTKENAPYRIVPYTGWNFPEWIRGNQFSVISIIIISYICSQLCCCQPSLSCFAGSCFDFRLFYECIIVLQVIPLVMLNYL